MCYIIVRGCGWRLMLWRAVVRLLLVLARVRAEGGKSSLLLMRVTGRPVERVGAGLRFCTLLWLAERQLDGGVAARHQHHYRSLGRLSLTLYRALHTPLTQIPCIPEPGQRRTVKRASAATAVVVPSYAKHNLKMRFLLLPVGGVYDQLTHSIIHVRIAVA